jgi:hypothetical protein
LPVVLFGAGGAYTRAGRLQGRAHVVGVGWQVGDLIDDGA